MTHTTRQITKTHTTASFICSLLIQSRAKTKQIIMKSDKQVKKILNNQTAT